MKKEIKKTTIDPMEHMGTIMKCLKKGVLITARNGDGLNSMTISWGQIGIEWNRLIFTTYVRSSRFTFGLLEEHGEFTVNMTPEKGAGKILSFCGTKSGRDYDKFKELGLNPVPGMEISTPGILELPLTLECRIVYKQAQDPNAIPPAYLEKFYPAGVPGTHPGANRDMHTMFYGEIVGAYIAE